MICLRHLQKLGLIHVLGALKISLQVRSHPVKGNQVKGLSGPATVTGYEKLSRPLGTTPGRRVLSQEPGNLPVNVLKHLRGKVCVLHLHTMIQGSRGDPMDV